MAISFHPVPSTPDEYQVCLVCKEPSDELICSVTCDDIWDARQRWGSQPNEMDNPEDQYYA